MEQYFKNCTSRIDIKKLYWTLAKKYHTDIIGVTPENTARMQEINAQYAYAVKHFQDNRQYHYKYENKTSYTQGTKTHYGTIKKRHYCHICKAKKDEIFMQFVGKSINNRGKWRCKNNCNQTEHRRFGTAFDLRKDTI